MRIKRVTTMEQLSALEGSWDGLLERSGVDNVALTFDWLRAWWTGFGGDAKLLVLLAVEGREVKGIAPLTVSRRRYRGFLVREVSFLENDHVPRSDFIVAEERERCLRGFLRYLGRAPQSWDIINLRNIPKDSPNVSLLRDILRERGTLHVEREGLHSPFLRIGTDWESFLAGRTKKFRKVLRNRVHRMEREGGFTVHHYREAGPGVIGAVMEISRRSWKGKQGRDILSDPGTRRFFFALSQSVGRKGWLSIWLLSCRGKYVAYEYHLRYRDRVYALRADYDDEYRDYAPGAILDMSIMKNLFHESVREYDMGGGENFYKLNWTQDVREHVRFTAYNNTTFGRLLHLVETRILQQLKKYRIVRALQDRLGHEHGPQIEKKRKTGRAPEAA